MTQQLDLNDKMLFFISEPQLRQKLGDKGPSPKFRFFLLDCWDEQTRIFTPCRSLGKLGGFSFDFGASFFLVIFGICSLGNPWVKIVRSDSSNSLLAWELFEPSGGEASTSHITHEADRLRTTFSASVKRFELYETPLVSVDLLQKFQYFRPKYSQGVLGMYKDAFQNMLDNDNVAGTWE